MGVLYRTVVRTQDGSGVCQPRAPHHAQPVQQALQGIQEHLNNTRRHFQNGDTAQWSTEAKSLMGCLRDCWERAVEDVVSPVLSRFDPKVKVGRLEEVLVLTSEDARTAVRAYGRISESLHTRPTVETAPLPTPDGVQVEIDGLKEWLTNIRRGRPQGAAQ